MLLNMEQENTIIASNISKFNSYILSKATVTDLPHVTFGPVPPGHGHAPLIIGVDGLDADGLDEEL